MHNRLSVVGDNNVRLFTLTVTSLANFHIMLEILHLIEYIMINEVLYLFLCKKDIIKFACI